jgi:hypothetical protein
VGTKKASKYDGLIRSRGRARAIPEGHGRGEERREDAPVDDTSPSGKRRNAEYRQVSAYVRKETHRKVKMALLEDDREFSELVEELLGAWLASRT